MAESEGFELEVACFHVPSAGKGRSATVQEKMIKRVLERLSAPIRVDLA